MLAGPLAHGGPLLFQLWRRSQTGAFERSYAGTGPAYSDLIGAWLHPQASMLPDSAKLAISEDAEGSRVWLTPEERERSARTRERAALRHEQALREAAERRAEELRARLTELEKNGR
jgi:hypothetical protein